jgi:hypothetical protein
MLAATYNRSALTDLSGRWIDLVHHRKPPKWITLDMDSSVSPTHDAQEGTAWNGHFGCRCYHPLFVFNQFGHLERCALRPGSVHSADGWEEVLKPVIARYADHRHLMRFFRGDAAFATPELYKTLEAERYYYAIRLRTNRVLQSRIAHLLKRPVGPPPKGVKCIYGDFEYQAASWDKPRRVIAKVEWHPGDLFPPRWLYRHQPADGAGLDHPLRMRVSASKSEEKRLDRAVQTSANQTESRTGFTAGTKNYVQLARRMPRPRHGVLKRLDPGPKQRQLVGECVLLRECRFNGDTQ